MSVENQKIDQITEKESTSNKVLNFVKKSRDQMSLFLRRDLTQDEKKDKGLEIKDKYAEEKMADHERVRLSFILEQQKRLDEVEAKSVRGEHIRAEDLKDSTQETGDSTQETGENLKANKGNSKFIQAFKEKIVVGAVNIVKAPLEITYDLLKGLSNKENELTLREIKDLYSNDNEKIRQFLFERNGLESTLGLEPNDPIRKEIASNMSDNPNFAKVLAKGIIESMRNIQNKEVDKSSKEATERIVGKDNITDPYSNVSTDQNKKSTGFFNRLGKFGVVKILKDPLNQLAELTQLFSGNFIVKGLNKTQYKDILKSNQMHRSLLGVIAEYNQDKDKTLQESEVKSLNRIKDWYKSSVFSMPERYLRQGGRYLTLGAGIVAGPIGTGIMISARGLFEKGAKEAKANLVSNQQIMGKLNTALGESTSNGLINAVQAGPTVLDSFIKRTIQKRLHVGSLDKKQRSNLAIGLKELSSLIQTGSFNTFRENSVDKRNVLYTINETLSKIEKLEETSYDIDKPSIKDFISEAGIIKVTGKKADALKRIKSGVLINIKGLGQVLSSRGKIGEVFMDIADKITFNMSVGVETTLNNVMHNGIVSGLDSVSGIAADVYTLALNVTELSNALTTAPIDIAHAQFRGSEIAQDSLPPHKDDQVTPTLTNIMGLKSVKDFFDEQNLKAHEKTEFAMNARDAMLSFSIMNEYRLHKAKVEYKEALSAKEEAEANFAKLQISGEDTNDAAALVEAAIMALNLAQGKVQTLTANDTITAPVNKKNEEEDLLEEEANRTPEQQALKSYLENIPKEDFKKAIFETFSNLDKNNFAHQMKVEQLINNFYAGEMDFKFEEYDFETDEKTKGALAAYSKEKRIIYYDKNSPNIPEAIKEAISYEIGHELETALNLSETTGDEGRIFNLELKKAQIESALRNASNGSTAGILARSIFEIDQEIVQIDAEIIKAKNTSDEVRSDVLGDIELQASAPDVPDSAVLKAGDGITQIFKRQLTENGITENLALLTKQLAIDFGYIDTVNKLEVRLKGGDYIGNVAYKLIFDATDKTKITGVTEYTKDASGAWTVKETKSAGSNFEAKADQEEYEYQAESEKKVTIQDTGGSETGGGETEDEEGKTLPSITLGTETCFINPPDNWKIETANTQDDINNSIKVTDETGKVIYEGDFEIKNSILNINGKEIRTAEDFRNINEVVDTRQEIKYIDDSGTETELKITLPDGYSISSLENPPTGTKNQFEIKDKDGTVIIWGELSQKGNDIYIKAFDGQEVKIDKTFFEQKEAELAKIAEETRRTTSIIDRHNIKINDTNIVIPEDFDVIANPDGKTYKLMFNGELIYEGPLTLKDHKIQIDNKDLPSAKNLKECKEFNVDGQVATSHRQINNLFENLDEQFTDTSENITLEKIQKLMERYNRLVEKSKDQEISPEVKKWALENGFFNQETLRIASDLAKGKGDREMQNIKMNIVELEEYILTFQEKIKEVSNLAEMNDAEKILIFDSLKELPRVQKEFASKLDDRGERVDLIRPLLKDTNPGETRDILIQKLDVTDLNATQLVPIFEAITGDYIAQYNLALRLPMFSQEEANKLLNIIKDKFVKDEIEKHHISQASDKEEDLSKSQEEDENTDDKKILTIGRQELELSVNDYNIINKLDLDSITDIKVNNGIVTQLQTTQTNLPDNLEQLTGLKLLQSR
jgi:hypothetical protein